MGSITGSCASGPSLPLHHHPAPSQSSKLCSANLPYLYLELLPQLNKEMSDSRKELLPSQRCFGIPPSQIGSHNSALPVLDEGRLRGPSEQVLPCYPLVPVTYGIWPALRAPECSEPTIQYMRSCGESACWLCVL